MAEPNLFIDPGSISLGYAWRENGKLMSGYFVASDKKPISERLVLIRTAMANIIERMETPLFRNLVIEIPVAHDYARNVGKKGKQVTTKSLFILSRAVGVIEECCHAHDMGVIEVEATKWAKGYPKQYRCSGASAVANKSITNPDEADAIGLMDWWERIGQNGR